MAKEQWWEAKQTASRRLRLCAAGPHKVTLASLIIDRERPMWLHMTCPRLSCGEISPLWRKRSCRSGAAGPPCPGAHFRSRLWRWHRSTRCRRRRPARPLHVLRPQRAPARSLPRKHRPMRRHGARLSLRVRRCRRRRHQQLRRCAKARRRRREELEHSCVPGVEGDVHGRSP